MRGRLLGGIVIVATLLIAFFAWQYTQTLADQQAQAILSLPAECSYDDQTLCPQAVDSVVIPDLTGLGLALLGILLGIYLFRSDNTQRRILSEMSGKREQLSAKERRELILSVLTDDERSVVEAVRAQPGITQATLRRRIKMSKAKLSNTLKGLEERGVLTKERKGKTNAVYLAMDLG